MSTHEHRGLTLVELLAVVAILAVIVALLLPAVQMAREAGRRTTCTNHQRELAHATLAFVTAHARYPGSVNLLAYRTLEVDWQTGLPNGTVLAHARPTPCSWAVPLLPYLERADLTERHASRRPGPETGIPINTHVETFVCPSDYRAPALASFSPHTTNSYAVNCGQIDRDDRFGVPGNPIVPDAQANGVFHNHFPHNHRTGKPKHIRLVHQTETFIQRGDGATSTLLLSENVDSGNWGAAVRIEVEVGLLWWPSVELVDGRPQASPPRSPAGVDIAGINQAAGTIDQVHPEDTATRNLFARPASMHPGGVVATFCDGHTTFLSEKTDYLVYCLLMTPDGRHAHDMDRNRPADELFRRTPLSSDSLE